MYFCIAYTFAWKKLPRRNQNSCSCASSCIIRSRDKRFSRISIVIVNVVVLAPVVPKQVSLCILASLILVIVYCVLSHHTTAAYVIADLIAPVYSHCTILGLSSQVFLGNLAMCWFQISLESKITPRSSISLDIVSSSSCKVRGPNRCYPVQLIVLLYLLLRDYCHASLLFRRVHVQPWHKSDSRKFNVVIYEGYMQIHV